MTRRAEMEPTLVLRGTTAATQRRRVLGHAATTGRPLLLHLQAPPRRLPRAGPALMLPSLQVAGGALVAVLGQLRRRVSDAQRALPEGF